MGISRDSKHKRRNTGGKRKIHRKKRKYELGRPAAMTRLGTKRIHLVRCRGGMIKHRALKLDHGNFSWASEGIAKKTRVLVVVYNASNNELVRTNTLVKNSIIQIDATPFRSWYEQHYGVTLGKAKATKTASAAPGKSGAPAKAEQKNKDSKESAGKAAPAKGKESKAATPAKDAKAAPAKGKDAKAAPAKDAKAATPAKGKDAKAATPAKGKDAKAATPAKDAKAAPAKDAKAAPAKDAKAATPAKDAKAAKTETPKANKDSKEKSADSSTKSGSVKSKLATRRAAHPPLDQALQDQFNSGRLYAAISSRPGQSGRCDGYILEGEELAFYLRKLKK